MKRHILSLITLLAFAPATPVLAQSGDAATFAGGVKAVLALDYNGMSRDAITRGTGWPLATPYQTWFYGGKVYKGLAYLYGGSDADGHFSVDYHEVAVDNAHHFAVRLLTDRAAGPEGGGCLPIRDLRRAVAGLGWTDVEDYQLMLAHGFTARKGKLSLDVRVDIGKGQSVDDLPALDDQGCVQGVEVKDVAG